MSDRILEALPGERVLQSNPLATVTTNCLIVKNSDGKSRTVIPISRLAEMKRTKTTYPGLLVLAAALFLLSAASYCSKQGGGATIPMAVLGLLFLLAYFGCRKASLVFVAGAEDIATPEGNLEQAASIVRAVSAPLKSDDDGE